MKKLLVLLSILLISTLAFGQAETTGRVTGNVVDEDGQPVVGALVSAMSPALLGERQQKTNERGEFLFALLPVGPYTVSISAPGMKTMDFNFRLNLGTTVPLNVTMQAGQDIVEEITVFGTATRFESTEGGENFNLETTVEELPIQSRRLEAIAFNAPNMTSGPNSTPRIAGANAFDTVVLLDGAEISDPLFGGGTGVYIEDAIEEVQVLTSGVSARYGRFQGGVLNAITKTGGNELTAAVRFEYQNQDWNSLTPYDEERDFQKADDLDWKAMATVGGYIMKDRLWFFGAGWYQPETTSNRTTRANQTYTRTDDEERYQYKLRGAITPNHVIDASYLEFEANVINYAGLPAGDALFATNGKRSDPRDMTTIAYQGVLGPAVFLDVMYTKKDVAIQSGGNPNAGTPIYDADEFNFYHNMWWDQTDDDLRNNETVGANLTYSFVTESFGSHTFEAGAQHLESTTGGANRQSGTGYNLLAWAPPRIYGPDSFVVMEQEPDGSFTPIVHGDGQVHFNLWPGMWTRLWVALPVGGEQQIDYDALYVQDSWEIGSFRIDAGLRYEAYSGNGPQQTDLVDYSSIAPRLGVTYNINQDWQVQAMWGHYQGRFNDKYAQGASGVGSAPSYTLSTYIGPECPDCTGDQLDPLVTDESNWAGITAYDSPGFPTVVLDPDLESGYAQDFNFAVKRALPNNTGTIELRYTNRSFKDLVDDYVGGDYMNTVDVIVDGTSFGSFDQEVWANSPEARRDYEAMTLTWDYRPNVTWNVGGNYTWSALEGNYTGEGTNTPASGSAIGDYPLITPQANAAPNGYLPGDTKHRIRAWANYRFDFERWGGLTLGGLFRYSSGTPYAHAVGSRDRWVDNQNANQDLDSTFTYFFEPRGSHRFNGSWAFDFSARYQVQVWKDLNAWLKLNVVNALDRDTLITFDTGVTVIESSIGVVDLNGDPVMSGGSQLMVDVPVGYSLPSSYGKRTGGGDYQTPRTYLLTWGLSWK